MKKRVCILALIATLLLNVSPSFADDGFYVIAGRGASGTGGAAGGEASGKVLKTQVFTSNSTNNTLGIFSWAKLDYPQWTYTKLSATSYLVITYQDSLKCTAGTGSPGISVYQLRVNDQPNVAGTEAGTAAAVLFLSAPTINASVWNILGATGVWLGLPKGDVNLSIWHLQNACTATTQGGGGWTTNVVVMEIEQ